MTVSGLPMRGRQYEKLREAAAGAQARPSAGMLRASRGVKGHVASLDGEVGS